MCALVVWIHHSQIKILEPRHRLQHCWQGSARTYLHEHVYMHTYPEEKKGPKSLEKEQTQGPGTAEPS